VNADRPAFEGAIRDLAVFKQRWPDALRAIITGRYPMEIFSATFSAKKAPGIKSVIRVGD